MMEICLTLIGALIGAASTVGMEQLCDWIQKRRINESRRKLFESLLKKEYSDDEDGDFSV